MMLLAQVTLFATSIFFASHAELCGAGFDTVLPPLLHIYTFCAAVCGGSDMILLPN